MMLCASSGMVGSIPMRFRHLNGLAVEPPPLRQRCGFGHSEMSRAIVCVISERARKLLENAMELPLSERAELAVDCLPASIENLTAMHASREPFYWRDRI